MNLELKSEKSGIFYNNCFSPEPPIFEPISNTFPPDFTSDQYYLHSLLPYDPEKKFKSYLRTGLNEYLLLLAGSLKAIDALELNDLEKFDALVGENACQIRAVLISIIASKRECCFVTLKNKINKAKDRICQLLKIETIAKLMGSEISLNEIILSENLCILLNFQEMFAIQCFFLREVKSSNYGDTLLDGLLVKEKCIPKRLKEFGDVSSSFADNLVSKLRKATAKQSVRFIIECAKKSQDKNLIRMLSDEFSINHNNHLLCTPMFWTYKAVLFAAKLEKVKIILHAKLLNKNNSCFEVFDEYWFDSEFISDIEDEGYGLSIKEIDWDNLDKVPCIVFQGVCCLSSSDLFYREKWKSDIQRFSVDSIILAGAADHRQYPREEDDNRFFQLVQDHEYETYRSLAREEGFSFENPSTFFIQHAYATNTKSLTLKTPLTYH